MKLYCSFMNIYEAQVDTPGVHLALTRLRGGTPNEGAGPNDSSATSQDGAASTPTQLTIGGSNVDELSDFTSVTDALVGDGTEVLLVAVCRRLKKAGLGWWSTLADPWKDPGASVKGSAGLLLRRAASDLCDNLPELKDDAGRAALYGLAALEELASLGLRWDSRVAVQGGPTLQYAGRAFAFAVLRHRAITWLGEDGSVTRSPGGYARHSHTSLAIMVISGGGPGTNPASRSEEVGADAEQFREGSETCPQSPPPF